MPQTELIKFRSGQFWAVNTNFRIGPNAENGEADLMLIQTLFRYLSYSSTNTKGDLGFGDADVPAVTGKFDARTQAVIRRFQQKNAAKLLSADGFVDPASYQGRQIAVTHWESLLPKPVQPVMTITLLHVYAWYAASRFDGIGNYIGSLAQMTPQLRSWLYK